MATQYRFKTVMVSDENREEFTKLRDSVDGVRITDKELFSAMFRSMNQTEVLKTVLAEIAKRNEQRELQKIQKLEQKLKEKLEKLSNTAEPTVAEEVPAETAAA